MQWRTSLPKYAEAVKDDAGLYLGLAPAEGRKPNSLCTSIKEKQHPRLSVGDKENRWKRFFISPQPKAPPDVEHFPGSSTDFTEN